ncbi:MAG: tRNA threonylcarbamoyladenosine dehydratase [Chitinophagales bacterium]
MEKNRQEIPDWMTRTELLLGKEALEKLMKSHVLVVGLGGVGGMVAEMLVRSGIGTMTILDADVVEASNKNRQIIALNQAMGEPKSDVLAQRLLQINPELRLQVEKRYLEAATLPELPWAQFSYVADCIDTLQPKIALMSYCWENKIPIVSAMGAGGRTDPSQIKISDISKTFNCYLAYYVRKKLHRLGIYQGIKVVFSSERPDKKKVRLVDGKNKRSVIGTISYMPNLFGGYLAAAIIQDIVNRKEKRKK